MMKTYYTPQLKTFQFEQCDFVRTSENGKQEVETGENFGFDFLGA